MTLSMSEDVELFVDWLYDESPVWPDEVKREDLLAAYEYYLNERWEEGGE